MNLDNKVLACVDQSPYADHVTDYAAWAARRMDAPLELLHVIDRHPEIGNSDDHSGALTPNAQEHLLDQLSSDDAVRTKAAREQGRIFLNRLRERALVADVVQVDVRQRHGHLDETLQDQQSGVRLFVLGRRGECLACHKRERADHLQEDYASRKGLDDPDSVDLAELACPNCGTRGAWTEPRVRGL